MQVRLIYSGTPRPTSLGHETVTPDEQCLVPETKARSEGVSLSVLESDLVIYPIPFTKSTTLNLQIDQVIEKEKKISLTVIGTVN